MIRKTLSAALVVAALFTSLFLLRTVQAAGRGATPPALVSTVPLPPPAVHMLLGNPSNATLNTANKDNFLMMKPYFTVSYNSDAGEPNWVSWRLTKEDLGTSPRKRSFDDDKTLPDGFNRIFHKDYTDGGFDRGHMCPHSDRARDQASSYATFVMTNIIPQAPAVNQKAWAMLEDYLRDVVEKENAHMYIVAGPAFRGGWGSKGFKTSLADGKVHVPAECWKIAVILPGAVPAQNDIAAITPATRVLAVIMPNDNSVGYSWAQYRTSVAEIENVTHLNFFDKLPKPIADALKKQVDAVEIPKQDIPVHGEEE